MKLLAAVAASAAVLLATPALASPLEPRQDQVVCRPTIQGTTKTKTLVVSTARAKAQIAKAGVSTGTSGDPHRYENGDRIIWGVRNCDVNGVILLEYPIYWDGKNGEWEKNVKTDRQKGGPTPIRVVYANVKGSTVFCGIMTHSVVNAQNQGLNFFQRCE